MNPKCIFKELKQQFGFDEYLEYVKGAPSKLFYKFHSGTQGLFEELGRHSKGMGHRSVLIVRLGRSQLSMFFLNVHHMISRDNFRTIRSEFFLQVHLKPFFMVAFSIKLYCR